MSPSAAPTERRWEDDLRLARACATGDDAAWREMESRHFPYIRAFARRFGLPDYAAEEVAQEVIGDLWRRESIGRYEGRSALRTWLGALITNAALTARVRLRSRGTREQSAPPPAAAEDPAASDLETALGAATSRALGALEAHARLLVLLHYEQRLTLEEIGRLEGGASKATMSRRLQAIRLVLREDIERRLAADGVSWSELRPDVDLSRLDLELGALLARTSRAKPPAGDPV